VTGGTQREACTDMAPLTHDKEANMSPEKPLITRTDFVFLPSTSFKKAEEFYSGVLGLMCSARYKNDIGGEFETGSLTIQVIDSAKIGREFEPSKGAIALHVDDVAAARADLEARGVAFNGEIMDSGVCHQAFFEDQDGNTLILHHRYAPRS
jgi:catechol 2,3-dioxygenase-like lactoylglutathione lyase family enzyme